jgi:flagellar hook-basal body complex protein FliE
MTSPIGGVALPTAPPLGALGGAGDVGAVVPAPAPASENGFAATLTGALDQLGGLQATRDELAVQAATGDLRNVHDYMIAAQKSSVATEMVVTLKNKAIEAFTEIMRMPV